jgi:Lon protease-like protein
MEKIMLLMPMFPLPSVLFPRGALPIQVFERRYLTMIDEVLSGDRRFGVVLIERGSEVGGGDQRFGIGTLARVVRVGALDDGRLALVAIGDGRFRVVDWLPERPYPEATIRELEEDVPGPGTEALLDRSRRAYRRAIALASELGGSGGDPDPDLPDDPTAASWFLCDAAPIEQLDRQMLLETGGIDARLSALIEALDAKAELLRSRLGRG